MSQPIEHSTMPTDLKLCMDVSLNRSHFSTLPLCSASFGNDKLDKPPTCGIILHDDCFHLHAVLQAYEQLGGLLVAGGLALLQCGGEVGKFGVQQLCGRNGEVVHI